MIRNLVTLLFLTFLSITSVSSADLKNLLPKNNELKNCKIADSIRVFKGDELFTYIDGGAEIFMEYGFKQVATANYSDKNNNQIQVEIFEMNDSAAAYGAYTFYLNGDGKPFNAGTEGVFIDYYAALWKENFVTVISASEYKDSLASVFRELAININNKILLISQPPLIVTDFRKSDIINGYIKYLKGNIGLSNVYRFVPGNSFTFNEGISFSTPETQIIIMKYETEATASFRLSEALTKMKEADKETIFKMTDNGFSFIDYKSNQVNCISYKNYIIVLVGKTQANCDLALEKVKKVLD